MYLCGTDPPGGRCHACERDISCCDHIGDYAYHGLVNLDVAKGQGCYGGNPTACFEQFNAAALGRVVPADSESKASVGKETIRCLAYISCMLKRLSLRRLS